MGAKGTTDGLIAKVLDRQPQTIILGDARDAPHDARTLANRAAVYDTMPLGAKPDPPMMEETAWTHVDRGNLMRTAKAIEDLLTIFRSTAKIEITNSALGILNGLGEAIRNLSAKVDKLDRTLDKMAREQAGTEIATRDKS